MRCGFLQYDNHLTQRPRRPTKLHIVKQLTQSQSAHGGSTSSSVASDPASSARVTLFHSIEGKKYLSTSLPLKTRYMMIVEHQWRLLKEEYRDFSDKRKKGSKENQKRKVLK